MPRIVNAIAKGRDASVELSMSSFKTPLSFLTNICIYHVYNQLLKLFCYKSGHIFLLLTDTVEETLHEYKQEQVFSSLYFRTLLLFQLFFPQIHRLYCILQQNLYLLLSMILFSMILTIDLKFVQDFLLGHLD